MENNVIANCFVLETVFGVEPTIYLTKPELSIYNNITIYEFSTVFEAKAYLVRRVGTLKKIVVASSIQRKFAASF